MRADRPLYLLPFRAVALAVLGAFLLGLVGGTFGAALVVRRSLKVTPGGERVIERVERVTVTAEDALASAAADLSPSTAVVLDEQSRVHGSAVSLTQDGVLVSAGPVPKGAIRIRRSSGEIVPASVVRTYPEIGVFFLRAFGTFSTPGIERSLSLLPGTALAAVVPAPEGIGSRVRVVTVETEQLLGSEVRARYRGLGRVPHMTSALPPSFRGAPLVGTDGRMRGVIVVEGASTFLVLGDPLDVLLQDFLQNQGTETIEVLRGLRGDWRFESKPAGPELTFRIAEASPGSVFASSGLRARDEIQDLDGSPLAGTMPLVGPFLRAAREQKSVTLTVRRGVETLAVQVLPSAL